MTTDGSRFLIHAGLLIAMLGVVATSLFIWFFAGLTFFGEPLTRTSYVQMAIGFGVGATLLVLVLVPAGSLGAAAWLRFTAVSLAALCFLAAVLAAVTAGTTPAGDSGEGWWWPVEIYTWSPATWVVVLLVGATPWLRGPSSPTPR